MRLSRIWVVLRKEFQTIGRDPKIYPLIVAAPLVQLFLYGYAATFDLREARVALYDADRTEESRALASAVDATDEFSVAAAAASYDGLTRALGAGEARIGLAIPKGFGRDVRAGRTGRTLALLDGVDANQATIARNFLAAIAARHGSTLLQGDLRARDPKAWEQLRAAHAPGEPPDLVASRVRVLYNPELKSRNYMIPGVFCMILLVLTTIFSAMAIVREKELGTMETLIATPVRPAELMIGKLAPYALLGFFDVALVLAAATGWFEVPVRGSVALLFAASGGFVLTTVGMGLAISTVSETQQQAMTTAFLIILPTMLLSGFIFPIENMPLWARALTRAVPMRYFLAMVRGIILKGVGLDVLWPDALALFSLGAALVAGGALRLRKTLA